VFWAGASTFEDRCTLGRKETASRDPGAFNELSKGAVGSVLRLTPMAINRPPRSSSLIQAELRRWCTEKKFAVPSPKALGTAMADPFAITPAP